MRARASILAAVLIMACASPALGQVVAVTPYGHLNFGDVEIRRGGGGLMLGFFAPWIGVELDVDYHSHFFKDAELQSIPNVCRPGVRGRCIDADSDAVIFSGNVVVPIPIPSAPDWSPYFVTGLGGIHAWIHDAGDFDTEQTNLAFNFGAGLSYWLLDWLALRADLRLLHAFVDEDAREGGYRRDYDFVRISLGISFAPFRSSG